MNLQPLKRRLVPVLTVGFFVLVSVLLYRTVSRLKWSDFSGAFGQMSWDIILLCLVLVVFNFLILTSFDFLGLRHAGNRELSYPKSALSAFLCYAFTLNLGALVGGVGFRFRIYTGWGIPSSTVPQVVFFSSFTNWIGHTTLLGGLLCSRASEVASLFDLPPWPFQLYGCVSLIGVLFYFIACGRGFVLSIKNLSFPFPRLRLAFLQLLLSFAQWGLISVIIFVLLRSVGANVLVSQVLFTTLVASIAGVFTHVPAGLGVLEVVFLKMNLGAHDAQVLAALLCYRGLYYVLPLILAVPTYFLVEKKQKAQALR